MFYGRTCCWDRILIPNLWCLDVDAWMCFVGVGMASYVSHVIAQLLTAQPGDMAKRSEPKLEIGLDRTRIQPL